MKPNPIAAALIGATFLMVPAAAQEDRPAPWPSPVADWKPVPPGEHPRLFFRKSDLKGLKERARTPEGKKILARLKKVLGGGDGFALPNSGFQPL